MRIILSPAKKMRVDTDTLPWEGLPVFLEDAEILKEYLTGLSPEECRKLWNCSESIAELNYRRLREMDLRRNLTPALLAYEGIQYQYMAPAVLEDGSWEYVQEHVRILSGFYGILKPLDGIVPYRLEMQAPVRLPSVRPCSSLYAFWGSRLTDELVRGMEAGQPDEPQAHPQKEKGLTRAGGSEEEGWILNLASKEYSRCILPYLPREVPCVTCLFGEEKDGKVKEKGTLVKMARGEMVRFLAERQAVSLEEIKKFDRLGYRYREDLSDENTLAFVSKRAAR